jgi:hypothetical protein
MDQAHGIADVVRLSADGHAEFAVDQLSQVLAEHGMILDEEHLAGAGWFGGILQSWG